MKARFISSSLAKLDSGTVCFLHVQDEELPQEIAPYLKGVKKERYEGKPLQTFTCDVGKMPFHHLVIVGLGKKAELKTEALRRAAGLAIRYASARKEDGTLIFLPKDTAKAIGLTESAKAICEGAILAGYKCTQFKTKKDEIFEVKGFKIASDIDAKGQKACVEGIRLGTIMAESQNHARAMDDQPANIATPLKVAQWAKKLANDENLAIEIFDGAKMKRMGMNALLAVANGSVNPPVLIRLEYNKGKKLPLHIVVGKGVTFDSGGISIKPSAGMHEMKYDKSGAMNVLGVMRAVSRLKLPIRVVGLMPLVENMPSGSAQRPGDIVEAYNGKTIEVLNTDAEGRLILADTLAYATEQKPDSIIDMATLTGAIIVSLGRHAIGLFSNDDSISKAINDAGEETSERVWRLPIWPEYGEMIKADFADIKNISEQGEAGSITAAMFLKEFVAEVKWAHLDIAAVDYVKWPHPYLEKGASGIGVRLVTETLARLAKNK